MAAAKHRKRNRYKYFRVTMECVLCLLQKPWSAKRNSEWFFFLVIGMEWNGNGNGFVRKLQLKTKNLMGCVCVAYYKFSTSTMSIKNMYSTHFHTLAHNHLCVYSLFSNGIRWRMPYHFKVRWVTTKSTTATTTNIKKWKHKCSNWWSLRVVLIWFTVNQAGWWH